MLATTNAAQSTVRPGHPRSAPSFIRSILVALLILAFSYVAHGIWTYKALTRAFEQTQKGDALAVVVGRFGQPSRIEGHSAATGYDHGSRASCGESCVLRLWYEFPFTIGTSPLSVDFDANQVVIDTYRWNSP